MKKVLIAAMAVAFIASLGFGLKELAGDPPVGGSPIYIGLDLVQPLGGGDPPVGGGKA